MAQDVNRRQETDRGKLLQGAADGAHGAAYRIEKWRLRFSVALLLGAVVASAAPGIAPAVAVVGACWSFASFGLVAAVGQRQTNVAATIQQQFDLWLYGLEWQPYAGEPVPDEELRRWRRKSTLPESRMADWYPDVTGLPDTYAILACQRENLTWDWRLRRRFAAILTVAASAWVATGYTIALIADLSVQTMTLRWFVPSSAAIILALQMAHAHRQIAQEKETLATLVRAVLRNARPAGPTPEEAAHQLKTYEEIQRQLYELRRRTARVPRWLFERYRNDDESDMRETVSDLRARLGTDGQ